MRPRVVISQCLLGIPCRYDGRCVRCEGAQQAAAEQGWIPVCPEILGGLPTPRTPAERKAGGVWTKDGRDVTEAYRRGAEQALRIAQLYGARYALLKERSPSCGAGIIYDGTFSGTRIPGDGVTAELLMQNGIAVYGESRLEELIERLKWDEEHDLL